MNQIETGTLIEEYKNEGSSSWDGSIPFRLFTGRRRGKKKQIMAVL